MGAKLYTIDKISEQQHTQRVRARARRETRPRARPDPARDVPGGSPPRAPVHPVGQSGREVARARAAGCGLRALTVIHTNNRDALIRAEC
eukprot:scaffold130111_cov67-Phaeocystis_antarctica.AAC.5